MTTERAVEPSDRIGQRIRHTHPWGFRCGQWGRVLGVTEKFGRPCYMVGFDDEVMDLWTVDDPLDPYEFAGAASESSRGDA